MSGLLDYTTEPRWTYQKPTEKAQPKQSKTHWDGVGTETPQYTTDYKLPVVDVTKERRNFPGVGSEQYVTEEDLADAVGDTWGTTETDATYKGKELGSREQGYSKINAMSEKRPMKSRWPTKRS